MGRTARFIPADSYFHVLSRGNNQQKVFLEKQDFEVFLKLLQECRNKFLWRINHYVLMENHYHLILYNQTPKNLSNGIKMLNQKYAHFFRKKYGGCGHLWQDRFKSFVIENKRYLLECGRYIELNPVRAGIVKRPEDYRWSSYRFYAFGSSISLIDQNPEYLGIASKPKERRNIYRLFMYDGLKEKRRTERYFRIGFYGSAEFGNKLHLQGLKSKNWRTGPRN